MTKSKNTTQLLGLKGASPVANLWRALKDILSRKPPTHNMNGLVSENRWIWFKKNLASLWKAAYSPYPYYAYPLANNGLFEIVKPAGNPTVIALLSDWASNTEESRDIAEKAGIQDYSIHMGDTYYVGNSNEMAENFDTDRDGTWPYGTLGSFAMLGNHEMYSGGRSYFTELLPYMGLYAPGQEMPFQVQQASFFCLENENWRVIALDTGYHSLTGILGVTPNYKLELPSEQKQWLIDTVKINDDNRGLIFLSHHQCWSAFEDEFPGPGAFISSLIKTERDVIWLWGHEHWFSVYGPLQLPNGSNVFARCIGNSGMPVELKNSDGGLHVTKNNDPDDARNRNLVLYDQRQRTVVDGNVPLGHNGYALLELDGAQAKITYYDDHEENGIKNKTGRAILEEVWKIDLTDGKLTGVSITDFTIVGNPPAANVLSLFGPNWKTAITPSNPPKKALCK